LYKGKYPRAHTRAKPGVREKGKGQWRGKSRVQGII
jgi:hypothetical protein